MLRELRELRVGRVRPGRKIKYARWDYIRGDEDEEEEPPDRMSRRVDEQRKKGRTIMAHY